MYFKNNKTLINFNDQQDFNLTAKNNNYYFEIKLIFNYEFIFDKYFHEFTIVV